MSNKFLYILLLVMAGLNIYLLFRTRNLTSMVQSSRQEHNHNHEADDAHVQLLRGRILLQAQYSPVELSPDAMVMDTTGKEVNLKSIFKNDEALVFFFTSNHCYSCIDGAIPRLEELAKSIGYDKIILLGQMREKRDILAFKSKYRSRLPIFSVDDSAIRSDAKNLEHPFLFLAGKNLQARNPFFIESNLPEVTDDYLREMRVHFEKRWQKS